MSVSKINRVDSASWYSKHPEGAPYFLEYLPLIDERNRVVGFEPSLSYERFIPEHGPNGSISEIEVAYVRGLVEHAEARGQIPVLTATRSIGRLPGLKAVTQGLHVLLYRNIFQQWCSYTEQASRVGRYFLDRTIDIVRMSQHDPVMREISAMFPVKIACEKDRNTFCQFLFLHLYCYAHAAPAADFVLDINRVIFDSAHRDEAQAVFAAQGLPIDLSDARPSIGFSLLTFPSWTEMRELISVMGRVVIARASSEAGRRFAQRAIDDLLDEHDRHAFHTAGIRYVLGRAITEGEAARAELAAIHTECSLARTDSDNSRLARQNAEAERDAALVDWEQAEAAREAEARARQVAEAARDASVTEREASRLDAETHRRASKAMEAELRAERTLCTRLKAVNLTEVTARQRMESERDAALAARDAAYTEREASRSDAETHRRVREAAEVELRAERVLRGRLEAEHLTGAMAWQCMESERDAALVALAAAEARHAALLRWSVAFHDSTAASWSWKLTRPLRWLGIGRPKRPRDPPV